MTTITVINQKGGVGKSTTAHAVGAGLRLRGFSVLMIDLDAQGNLTYALGADSGGVTSFNVLTQGAAIGGAIQHTAQGDVIASGSSLAAADTLLTAPGKEYTLRNALEPLRSRYDFAVIDTPPALGVLTVNALTACDFALVPALADVFSLQGIAQLGSTVEAVRTHCNPSLRILGIVLTRYSNRAILSREIAEMLTQTAEQLRTQVLSVTIRECIALREAQAWRQDIYGYSPKSNAAIDYGMLTDIIVQLIRSYP